MTNQLKKRVPAGIPTILDGVDDLEDWTRPQLTASIQTGDWDELMLACPTQAEAIREARVQLTRMVFQHPANPYECYLISSLEKEILCRLYSLLQQQVPAVESGSLWSSRSSQSDLPEAWKDYWLVLQSNEEPLLWVTIARRQGAFSLHCAPAQIGPILAPIWSRQPVVLIGSVLDQDAEANTYRQRLGLGDLTCLKFSADRHSEVIQLYLPDSFPLPNTPQFQAAFVEKVHSLLCLSTAHPGLTVVLVGDMPLKSQVGTILAAEFGSRVQVEKTCLDDNSILVAGWEFWRQYQAVLPTPQLLVISTLPIPSLENPLVASRVAYYKRSRQDWFRLYLLPVALSELARAIAPVRERQGVVALLDSRVLHRSYGSHVLAALSPLARVNYLDHSLFSQPDE